MLLSLTILMHHTSHTTHEAPNEVQKQLFILLFQRKRRMKSRKMVFLDENGKLAKKDRIWMRMGPSDGEFHTEFEFNTPGAIRGQERIVMKVFHVR